jgi:protoporphyrinogen oxidase
MKKAIIIGAGPAGLTAAYELLTRTDIKPIIVEMSGDIGGLSKTVNHKGNRIDIGGHRFFSKSERVMDWWLDFLPLSEDAHKHHIDIRYQNQQASFDIDKKKIGSGDKVMLLRPRRSRIYYLRKFFDYPITLSLNTLSKLGIIKVIRIGTSYLMARIKPIKPEINLAQFFINRFGKELYETFFKDYTEKVWGVKCEQIPADWGRQRVKGLSISKAIAHSLRSLFNKNKSIGQKGTETSLIEQFLYPKYGPGQMWETVAEKIVAMGGEILLGHETIGFEFSANHVQSVIVKNSANAEEKILEADLVFSSMPVKQLINGIRGIQVPEKVKQIANGLEYRDFITVGVLVKKLAVKENNGHIKDNWIYIQEKNVQAGRLQIFNNWSPFMVKDPNTVWLGVEYFCNTTDDMWQLSDAEMSALAVNELSKIGIIHQQDVLDSIVIKMQKAYPSYYGSYADFEEIIHFLNRFGNLFPIGRNGMHKYNNSDHSMLTAMTAVDNIVSGISDKTNIWQVNTETDYYELKKN